MTPSLKTCLELEWLEVAPMNADESVNGDTTTFSGTSVMSASLPLRLRVPSFRTGLELRNMECLHVLLVPLMRTNPREKSFLLVARNGVK